MWTHFVYEIVEFDTIVCRVSAVEFSRVCAARKLNIKREINDALKAGFFVHVATTKIINRRRGKKNVMLIIHKNYIGSSRRTLSYEPTQPLATVGKTHYLEFLVRVHNNNNNNMWVHLYSL